MHVSFLLSRPLSGSGWPLQDLRSSNGVRQLHGSLEEEREAVLDFLYKVIDDVGPHSLAPACTVSPCSAAVPCDSS